MSEDSLMARTRMATAVAGLLSQRRSETVEMLTSCKINARDIPLDVKLRRVGGAVFLERFVRDARTGQIRHHRGEVLTEKFSIEPKRIPDWIPSN